MTINLKNRPRWENREKKAYPIIWKPHFYIYYTYSQNWKFVDSACFIVGLLDKILVDILEIGDSHVLLKFLIQHLSVVDQLYLLLWTFHYILLLFALLIVLKVYILYKVILLIKTLLVLIMNIQIKNDNSKRLLKENFTILNVIFRFIKWKYCVWVEPPLYQILIWLIDQKLSSINLYFLFSYLESFMKINYKIH